MNKSEEETAKSYYQCRLALGKIAEVGTQYEDPIPVDWWKVEVEEIVDHKTEGAKMGVRFEVKWKDIEPHVMERSQTILEKGGKRILSDYLKSLGKGKRGMSRLSYLLANEKELARLLRPTLDEDEPALGA